MSITTKTGDAGETSLANGERVYKDDVRVETYGTVDELNSFLGLAKHFLPDREKELLESIQKDLFRLASELAKGERFVRLISEDDVERLTKEIQEYERRVDLTTFALPGETIPSAYLDVCRTVARRAERLAVKLSREAEVRAEVIKYLNRVSDLLYIIARYIEGKHIIPIKAREL